MNQRLKTVYIEQLHDYSTSYGITVVLRSGIVQEWCMAFSLLRYRLVEVVEVTTRDKAFALLFRLSPHLKQTKKKRPSSVSRVTWHAHQAITELSYDAPDYLLHFALDFYARGTSPVDHIDLEVHSEATANGKTLDLVVQIAV